MPRYFATSSHGHIEIVMSLSEARSASHQGRCDDDVAALMKLPHIARQLAEIDPEAAREELAEYGVWDDDELADHEMNLTRILWFFAGQIVDEPLRAREISDAERRRSGVRVPFGAWIRAEG